MNASLTSAYLPDAFRGAAWTGPPDLRTMAIEDDRSLAALAAERELHDFTIFYAYTLDRGDIDEIMGFFTADCVMESPRGTFTGTAELRAEYERMVRDTPHRMHQFSNIVVRLASNLASAYVSCYVTAILEVPDGSSRQIAGHIVIQVVRIADGWRIQRRWVANDVEAALTSADRGGT